MAALAPFFEVHHWSLDMIERRYATFADEEARGRALTFVVIGRETGQIVGHCGFKNIDRTAGQAEFGIILHKTVWGSGMARECLRLCLSLGFETNSWHRIYFQTSHSNARMTGLFRKLGIQAAKSDAASLRVYELLERDWPVVKAKLA